MTRSATVTRHAQACFRLSATARSSLSEELSAIVLVSKPLTRPGNRPVGRSTAGRTTITFRSILASTNEAGSLTDVQHVVGHQALVSTKIYAQRIGLKRDRDGGAIARRSGLELLLGNGAA